MKKIVTRKLKHFVLILIVLLSINFNAFNQTGQTENKLNMGNELNSYSRNIITNGSPDASYFDELSRFLSGMSVPQTSRFYKKTQTAYFKRHIKVLDNIWDAVEKNTISKIESWQKINVPKINLKHVAFYPLSGADFINLYLMFPEAHDYLMVALEKPGDAPQIDKLGDNRMSLGLKFVQNGLIQYGNNNYFASRAMSANMHNDYITGVTPIMMIFMTRMGHKVIDVKPIGIGENGKLNFIDKKGMIGGRKVENTGILIHFKDKTTGAIKRLVYVVSLLNAENISMKTSSGKYFNGIARVRTIMKSAIYLCHWPNYKKLADYFLEKSDVIIQDDSAIPYRFFDRNWDIKLYGNYIPMKIEGCKTFYQLDLVKEYKRNSQPLPFYFGYGILFGKDKSNMLIAVRKR